MKFTTALGIALCLLTGITAVRADDSPAAAGGAELQKVTIQTDWFPEPEFGGIYAAEHEGIFKKHGLDVQILKGGPDVPVTAMVESSKVEFGVVAADEIISARANGGHLVGIFATFQTSPQGIMVRKDRPVKNIPELLKSGGTLIAQPGLAYLQYFKEKYGLSGVTIIPDGSPSMGQFCDPGNKNIAMQCFISSEPLTAKDQGVDTKVFLIADTGFNPYTSVIATTDSYLKDHADTCQALQAALREGWAAYLKNPAPTNEVMAKLNPSMDLKTFAAAAAAEAPLLQSSDTKKHGLGYMSPKRWKTLCGQLLDLKVIDAKVKAKSCFNNLQSP